MSILQFKTANCKNCYKCVRHCPVKSIRIVNQQAEIIESECVLCGNCTAVCPQNAKEDISDIPKIKAVIGEKKIIASVAPSYLAYFDTDSFSDFRQALISLGMTDAYETAEGAYLVKSQFEKNESTAGDRPVISSCCSSVNLYIQKHFPKALPFLSTVISPMQAHVKLLKERFPDAYVVFISPCISKKSECAGGQGADFCVTFDELDGWFAEKNISVKASAVSRDSADSRFTRQFPISGGVLGSMKKADNRSYVFVDGSENCKNVLEEIVNGGLKGCFVEMNYCEGGCVGGASFRKLDRHTLSSRLKIHNSAGNDYGRDFNIETSLSLERSFSPQEIYRSLPNERQIQSILRKMGKNSPADELNCGMCGYSSCREKAAAVFEGKAEISMCLPFMKERAESVSGTILDITPNAIVAVDGDLHIQYINAAACKMFKTDYGEIKGSPVSAILDEFDFVDMLTSDKKSMTKHTYLPDFSVYVEQEFRYDKASGIVICVMKNITQSRQQRMGLMKAKVQAANMADEIVEKQLRAVHEIAALLGETAAETKAAVHNLKETIMMDSEDD